ncbi:MAG: dephospho-CoA kinase [Pyrinomonadaceae bacterium]|nr:dephospho-CoA kinase [Pyrinomonadaceae bacterium]
MLRVGLTGSIAVGKSFVTDCLREAGCRVIDADSVARAVVEPGQPGLARIAEAFGTEVLRPDGMLDRARLGAIVFADEKRRVMLNAILHPLIIASQDEQLRQWERQEPHGIGVVDAALMIETGSFRRFDKLIVVHCAPEVQIERLMKRDHITREAAQLRIASQMPQQQKMAYADYLIDTTSDFDETRRQTHEVYRQLNSLKSDR